jgi:carbonic anhydrase
MGNTYDTEIARIEADHIQTKWRTTEDYRWGYTGDRGPETWWVHYPSASGGMQSPVDIVTEETLADTEFGPYPLQIFYHVPHHHAAEHPEPGVDEMKTMVNTGGTVRVNFANSKSYITGGPCRGYTFVLEQFHIHWGEADNSGSEHLVNSLPQAAELHLVHWNEDLYSCYEDAAKSDGGIVILSVLLKLSDVRCNDGINYLSNNLDDIVYRDQSVLLTPTPAEFNLASLLPDNIDKYWTYHGSFCTPPCYETVSWVVFEKTSYVNGRVLNKFRSLRTYCENETRPDDDPFDGEMTANRRPPQPIGTRKVAYVDCALFREHHHVQEDGWRPFRSSGVGDGAGDGVGRPRDVGGGGGRHGDRVDSGGRPRKQPPAGVRIATFQDYVGKHRRDGVHGG